MGEVKTDTVNFSLNLADCSPSITNVVTQTIQILQKVIENDKEEQKKKESKKRWKPELGEDYFYIMGCGSVSDLYWSNDLDDQDHYILRNVFKTKEEAEFEVERRKIMAELQNYADEHNGKITHPSEAFWLGLDEDDMSITVEYESYLPPVGTVLFSDADTAMDAVKVVGEERILKYMFGVTDEEVHCNGDCECCDEYDSWDEFEEDESKR
mgnify:CR=1 FL=1